MEITSYEPMRAGDFARALFATEDLDPMYVMLHRSGLPRETLARWVLAMCCFYRVDTACRIAECDGPFWAAMKRADRQRWPRSTERRGFWGNASFATLEYLSCRYADAASAIDDLAAGRPTFRSVTGKMRDWPHFGPYFRFKLVDFMDRVLGVPVDVSDCTFEFERKPYVGMATIADEEGIGDAEVFDWLARELDGFPAPPARDRPANVLEFETVLCKFAGHRKGTYDVGQDIREIQHCLATITPGWMAPILVKNLPPNPDRSGSWESAAYPQAASPR